MRIPPTAAALAIALLSLDAAPAAQDETIVPVHEEPRHHLVFDSPGTRILDVQVPPGDTTLYHTHSDPILYVSMSASRTRSQTLGGQWSGGDASQPASAAPAAPGRITSTTSYAVKALTHRVNNVGQTLFRLIGITNASAGDATDAPSPGFDGPPELANPWFRGYRLTLDATAREHRHGNPVAIVLVAGRAAVSGGAIAASGDRRGLTAVALDAPGAFAWIEPDTAHAVRASGGMATIVEVEVRRPRSPSPLTP